MCGNAQVDAIVFLVDAIDRARFPESKRELDGLLADEALAKVKPPSFPNPLAGECAWPWSGGQ